MSFLINLPCFLLNFLRLDNRPIIIVQSCVYWRSKIPKAERRVKIMATWLYPFRTCRREQGMRTFEKRLWVIHELIKCLFFSFWVKSFPKCFFLSVNIYYHIVWEKLVKDKMISLWQSNQKLHFTVEFVKFQVTRVVTVEYLMEFLNPGIPVSAYYPSTQEADCKIPGAHWPTGELQNQQRLMKKEGTQCWPLAVTCTSTCM